MGLFSSRRKRSKPVRRGSSWPLVGYVTFYVTLALLATLSIFWGYYTLHNHEMFSVDTLEIVGATTKTEQDLRHQLAFVMGGNFFSMDLAKVRSIASAHIWVEHVAVKGHLPRRVKVVVGERVPAGLVKQGRQVMVVSDSGEVIAPISEMNESYPDIARADELLDLPILVGIPTGSSRAKVVQRGLAALKMLRNSSLLFWGHIETLDLSDEKNMIIRLRNVGAPIFLGNEVIPRNIRNYLTIAHHIEKEYPRLSYIELGFPNHVAIMPKEAK